MPITFTSAGERNFFLDLLREFQQGFSKDVMNPILTEFQIPLGSPSLSSFNQQLVRLESQLRSVTTVPIDKDLAPIAKLIILHQRRKFASDIDVRRAKTTNPELIDGLNGRLVYFDTWMAQQWLQQTTALKMPRLSDFLNQEVAELLSGIEQHVSVKNDGAV